MKTEAQFALLISVMVCFIFSISYVLSPVPKGKVDSWAPNILTLPRYSTNPEEVSSAAMRVENPFRPRFFEKASFKGLTKNPKGEFSAIFLSEGNKIVQLAPGQTLDGITLVEASAGRCRLLIGSVSKELAIQRK